MNRGTLKGSGNPTPVYKTGDVIYTKTSLGNPEPGKWIQADVATSIKSSTALGKLFNNGSPNGFNWVTVPVTWDPSMSGATLMAYGNGVWLGFNGASCTTFRSTDGVTWSILNMPSPTGIQTYLTGLAYGNGYFVAGGPGAVKLTYSTDGLTWATIVSPSSQQINNIQYLNNKFYVIGYTGSVITSTDAITWVSVATPYTGAFSSIAYNGSDTYMMGDLNGSGYVSTNGTTWYPIGYVTPTSIGQTGLTYTNSIAYNNGVWVAGDVSGNVRSITTNNTVGTTWVTQAGLGASPSYNRSVVAGTTSGIDYLVAGLSSGIIKYSNNYGSTWTTATSNTANTIGAIAYNGSNLWVAGDSLGNIRTAANPTVAWATQTSNLGTSAIFSANYGNGVFVVGATGGAIRYSTDGVTWNTATSSVSGFVYDIGYNGSIFVAVDDTGRISTSTNGITWVTQTSNTTNALRSVSYGGGKWVAAGSSSTVRVSTDAITWNTQVVAPLGAGASIYINYLNGLWVTNSVPVVANIGTMAYSTDTVTWTTATNFWTTSNSAGSLYAFGRGYAWNSSNSIAISSPYVWATASTGVSGGVVSIIAAENKFFISKNIAAGLITSTNGTTWATVTTNFSAANISTGTLVYGNGHGWVLSNNSSPEFRYAGAFDSYSFTAVPSILDYTAWIKS